MVDFGWIHNGLPRRVHAWFDVDPEESPGRHQTAAAYLKATGIAIRAPGGWGAPLAVKTELHTADFRRRLRRYVYKPRGVATPEESSMHGN